MRFSALLANAQDRVRRPGTWGGGLLIGGGWNLLRWITGPAGRTPDGVLVPFLLGLALAVLAPLPWRWTGDERPLAPFPRGLIQAAAVNLALVWSALAALPWPVYQAMRPGPNMMWRGMMMGESRFGPFLLPLWRMRLLMLGLATFVFGVLLGRVLAVQEVERIRADQAERFAREAQIRALQAQMNPHVLFNTISGLAELAHEESPATETALVKLADMLRRLLDHSGSAAAPLAQERNLVERLLDLEQFRLGERLRVTWAWDASLEQLLAPPLLLQPLVENAIRHGIAPHRAGGSLEIGLAGTPERVRVWVANTGQPYREGSPEGVGLSNLRQRLALMPGMFGQLELRTWEGRTLADLHFKPLEADHG